jgi:hypothetical protein
MQRKRFSMLLGAAALSASLAPAQQYLMVTESTNDRVMLLDGSDGSVVDLDFIVDAAGTPFDFSTPKEAIQAGSEIWVFDQVTDQVVRFDVLGKHIATILPAVGMVDNMRGGGFANNTIYVSNDGSGNGATADTIVMFDVTGTRLGQFSTLNSGTSPFDVVEYNGELLVPHFTSVNNTARYDFAGNLLGIFHASGGVTGVDNPEQVNVTAANTVLIAGFSTPIGIYEIDSTGTQINAWPVGNGNRGVAELGNGNILFTDGNGVHVLDRALGTFVTVVPAVAGQYISPLDLGAEPTRFCTAKPSSLPGCTALLNAPAATVSKSGGAGSYDVTAGPAPGGEPAFGTLIYSTQAPPNAPILGGFGWVCVDPLTRTGLAATAGGTLGTCDGTYLWDFGAYVSATAAIVPGDTLYIQGWYRDSGFAPPDNANLTDAIGPVAVTP